ncbi:major facilitator superfamily domain-containing protein [Sporodiniella umbellata]|nr:major facilitator superfamily domain-containing protein [Sporodiniella umbellata]
MRQDQQIESPTIAEEEQPMLDEHNQELYISEAPGKGSPLIKGPNTTIQIIFLTICLAGLQFTWTVEMAYGTPYLLSLGLTKSYMSLVWIAGPLSGLVMQPVVGVISDGCSSRWGRRRPFLIGGSFMVIVSLLIIGWTREIAYLFTQSEQGDTFKAVSIFIAIASIYILDFSINCVQASCRALIVDSLPPSQQGNATAWAGRMIGLGSVAGYFMGYVDLVKYLWFLGDTQLKVLCVLATLILLLGNLITCYTVREKTVDTSSGQTRKRSPFRLFGDIFKNIWNLPTPIQRICNVQFFAWIGWFPFLFYSTTWVAEIYTNSMLEGANPPKDPVGQATRAGSFAFLVYSLVSLFSSFFIPIIVHSSDESESQRILRLPYGTKLNISFLNYLKMPFLTLPISWTISHFIFSVCMLSTFFVNNVTSAAVVIGLCGISWAVTMWAPFSLIGEYISAQEAAKEPKNPALANLRITESRVSLSLARSGVESSIYQPVMTTDDEEEEDIEMVGTKESHRTGGSNGENSDKERPPAAGVLLGIHNMYIVLPQFLVTFFSSIVFKLLEGDENDETSIDTIGIVLRVGAVMAAVAGFLSLKIGRP